MGRYTDVVYDPILRNCYKRRERQAREAGTSEVSEDEGVRDEDTMDERMRKRRSEGEWMV